MKPFFQDDQVTLYCGDALDILPSIERASCVALDPPYSTVPNAKAGRDDGAAGTSAAPVRLLTETLRQTRRLLPEGGVAGLICDWRRLPDVSYLATLTGLRIATCIAWTRGSPGLGGLFRSAWDPMLVLSVGAPIALDRAAIRNVVHAEKPTDPHPYAKPVALWRHLFDRLPPGLVVDPYAGTGAALLAARAAGHRAIGIEVEERYCELAALRLSQLALPLAG
jgi:site-specific DNA-methyltransferase (adenine-specific)